MTTTVQNVAAVNNNSSGSANNKSNTAITTAAATAAIPMQMQQLQMAASTTTTTTPNGLTTTPTAATATATTRTMQSDEDFNIRFVNLVRTHKCLYDKKVPEYRNRDNQEKAWSLISQETRESVIHCKERWRNLRACLSRYIKQQSGADPQHKPYYLTEHMAFLLPFLKSTRNSLDSVGGGNVNSLASLFQISHQQASSTGLRLLTQPQLQYIGDAQQLEMKHSLSDNGDEETIDAFDPAVTASLQMQRDSDMRSPAGLSDTASANSMQNFIPDVQLAELRTPEAHSTHNCIHTHCGVRNMRSESSDLALAHEPKRIKIECEATTTTSNGHTPLHHLFGSNENADMEFFRSILPDLASLTPQQKRKFKIGILELIDDVLDRFPTDQRIATSTLATCSNGSANSNTKQRRNSSRDWRK